MREELQPAFVLHLQPYRNTSALVDFLTRDFGRVTGVVKGVYRQSKAMQKLRGQLRPGNSLQISWFGRSDLKTIGNLEQYGQPLTIAQEKLFSVLYINELLVRLLRSFDAHSILYDRYALLLQQFATGLNVEIPLRLFEFSLLQELGYGIDFEYDADSGSAIDPQKTYLFRQQSGFVCIDPNDPGINDHEKMAGELIIAVARVEFDEMAVRRLAKRISRMALQPLLGSKPLRSRELFGYRKTKGTSD